MSLPLTLLFVPLALGVVVNGIFGAKLSQRVAGIVGCAAIGLSFLGGIVAFSGVRAGTLDDVSLYQWIAAGSLSIDAAFRFDALSAVMTLVVTGVSFLIHIYSVGYMNHEDRRGFSRFFAYLNLFVFAMLILVLGDSYLLMFVGWEGVGLCSYLLIGFWYQRGPRNPGETYPSQAGKKAFVVNRIGDFGFLLGMFFIFLNTGSLRFDDVFHAAEAGGISASALKAITLLLFVGAIGKSAQLPLHVWLPDAMQGPTSVSALIHAATMVTAGVYMVARSHVLYTLAQTGEIVAWFGILTAVFAATMAIASFDIKGVLAYSTISQLGYMFVGVGLGAYSAGIAHLMTHAFFKGLMFLAAGSVLHAMHDELDMRKMGGLLKKTPITFVTFFVGALAIAGFPLLSGFFSKDAILLAAFQHNGAIFWIGLLTAFLTAFYMFRLIAITFFGEPRDYTLFAHAHESPPSMTFPLLALAALSAAAGALLGFTEDGPFYAFLNPMFHGEHAEGGSSLPMILSIVAAIAGILIGWRAYVGKPAEALSRANPVVALWRRKWFVDELYDFLIVHPLRWTSDRVLWRIVDNRIIDGLVNLTASAAWLGGAGLRTAHSGIVQTYAFAILAGAVILVAAALLR
ncbi:NADH-quinone oxidoreductase subunit L [Candidatus Poribacteria bacterium]|nr:NADH-quinone oxidoreductase subunit L [Candidatus Poribacteria bacterium]